MTMALRKIILIPAASLILVCGFFSCGDDRWSEYADQTALDSWMYDIMLQHYLWYEEMPAYKRINLFVEPSQFLSNVKASGDNFSYVDTVMETPPPSYGFDYSLVRDANNDTAYNALITYVIPYSPAEEAGLKRGDWIMKMDTFYISKNNEVELLQGTDAVKLTLGVYKEVEIEGENEDDEPTTEYQVVESGEMLNMSAARIVEDVPIHTTALFTLNDGDQVAYLMYNSFTAGTTDNAEKYNDELRAWSTTLAGNNIHKVILDLRYNAGGTIDCVQLLSTILAPSSYLGQPMIYLEYNDKNNDRDTLLTFDSQTLGTTGSNLNLTTLIVLLSSTTAGAPEMLIHSLNGKIQQIVAIGSSTKGQNVATEQFINDELHWSINPAVCTVYNADYETYGYFSPTYSVSFATDYVYFLPFGDPEEKLLSVALGWLNGTYPENNDDETGNSGIKHPELKIEKSVNSPSSRRFTNSGLKILR